MAGALVVGEDEGDPRVLLDGFRAGLMVGGGGMGGELVVNTEEGQPRILVSSGPTLLSDGIRGDLRLGGAGVTGELFLHDDGGERRIHPDAGSGVAIAEHSRVYLNGNSANLRMGSNGIDREVCLFSSSATDIGDGRQATIHLDAETGDIRLFGGDCADHFELAAGAGAEAGTVLVMDGKGKLAPCGQAYGRRTVGVISGTGGLRPRG